MTESDLEFAARRRVAQDDAIAALLPTVTAWVADPADPEKLAEVAEALSELYVASYLGEGGERRARTAGFLHSLRSAFGHTREDSDPQTVATWFVVATQNAAGVQAAYDDPAPSLLKWTTMHDSHVREAHATADRQRRPAGTYFHVGGENLRYPGDPRGRLDNTINCRCVLQKVPVNQVALLAAMKESTMPLEAPLAWHGILAPEDEWSGDGRRFAAGALRNRDLPLPLTWQRASGEGHDGSVVVARIDSIERVGNMMHGEGVFIDTPETDEVVGLIAEFGRFGVSVDADDSEFEFDEDSGQVTFTSARIASASLVAIPAFASAFVALGPWAEADSSVPPPPIEDDEECDPDSPDYEQCLAEKAREKGLDAPADEKAAWVKVDPSPDGEQVPISAGLGTSGGVVEMISEESWDGSAGRFTPEQWKKSTILHVCDGLEKSCHKLPIREPGGALSRAGVHAAASRFNQVDAPTEAKASAARSLRGAYKQLGEDPPEALKADGSTFGRGPGWVTNPEDTRRIWAYWTQPGHEGYAKINWGVPGDFNRCRVEVGEEIGENSPDKLRFLNQICAQWHHDALGYWPGRAPSEQVGSFSSDTPALTLVAAGGKKAPADWFADPQLPGPTHLTVTEDGRVFGHIAEWKTCHIGYDGVCVAPPSSASDYAYFASGHVLLDNGEFARTGVISLGGGHAGPGLSFRGAIAHYDSTSSAACDVSVGEDEHGIWCAGWVRPGVDDNAVAALRASDVSGDWREIGGQMEMVAALAVNVGGFPVAAVRDKVQVTLVAAGMVRPAEDTMALLIARATEYAVQAAFGRRAKMAALRERVGNGV